MIDPRLQQLANTIVNHSLEIKKGDKVVIESTKNCSDIIKYLIDLISQKGAFPFVVLRETDIKRNLIIHGNAEQFDLMKKYDEALLNSVDAYINITDSDNCYDMSDIPSDKRELYQKHYFQPIYFELIVPKLRWVTADYPSISSAQQFGMSTEGYEKYFFDAVNIDYKQLEENMKNLKYILDNGKIVTIKAPNVDLEFSIEKYKSEICSGKINLPDGEIFIAPQLESAKGVINFNVPTRYQGSTFEDLSLTFENGKVIKYSSKTNQAKLDYILNSDDGNRYIGEFAIGTNPNIDIPRSNILFDEKILGSFHLALGNSHSLSDNGNKASIHWDIVHMLTKEYGGGSIFVDDVLIQEDGEFVLQELQSLNKCLKKRHL